uniref:Putative type I S-subunit protein n=2 Tax=Streptococcaceae TaxID=1300 RepID=O52188_STRTR|nr:restriction endonuclease subunit S [Streptococcus thermophilus]AAC64909.1 putative type I S-subunit protein [Streptococcus thermophilus]
MAKIDDSVKKEVPELRFKGFTDDWEERKLGELANIVGGGTPSTSNPEYWDGDIDWYAPAEIGEQSYVSKSKKTITELGLKNSSARILPVGTVLFTSRAGIGNTAILAKEATTNQGFQSIVPDQNKLDSYFIFSRTNELKRYGEVTGAGSTFVEVSGKQMSKMSIMVPELSEQQKIGSFFKQLDETITLHQRKLDLLKEQKKGFLQKMFPKNGAKVPELRLKGFTDDWEERKLGELANLVGGGTPRTSNPEYWDGDIDWYAPAEIGEQSYVSKSKKTITELGLKNSSARILPVGTVLFTSRAGIGNTAILAKEATTNQGYLSIVPDQNKLDSYFIFSRTNELKRYGEVTGAGSTFVEVSGKQMSKMSIMVPELSEQQKIGLFFKHLDDTITFHQRKLDLLKEQKKGFLQKMFI